ncbi:ATP-binding protein [Ferrimonas sp. SCSIO 43195]|uniref:ATP-binding protein n=1 Tax=Ferrimonas sp. SCSIO 43195 TaxID=2822844 RepID=UPI002075A0C1|nr:ATP-binding protein [Ferrimonas sp. SCSIO 43195]USD37543.1 hypothetical protein J8Z22_21675 [Ferrimonas sp. SCSIO 43195]
MTKLIPPLFTRLYLSMILALVGSIVLTLNFASLVLDDSDTKDFYADTHAAYSFLYNSWRLQPLPPAEFFDALDLWNFPFEVRWQVVPTPPCTECDLVAKFDLADVYRFRDNDDLLASFSMEGSEGRLLLIDHLGASGMPADLEAAWEDDPEEFFPYLLFLMAILAMGAALYVPARQLQTQIQALTDTQQRFGQGQLDARAEVPDAEPVRQLANSFNTMASAISTSVHESRVFAQAVPHELRTPLSRIQLANGLLRKQCSNADQIALLDNIDAYVEDMDQLTNQVLTLVRLHSLDRQPEQQLQDLSQLLEQRLAWFKKLDALPLRCFVKPLPQYAVDGSCFRLLFDNLVSNAQRYGHSQVQVTAEAMPDGIQIAVEEDGQGISAEDHELIFLPFSRLDASRNQATGGLGLGLAIAQAAANRMGAKIQVSDSPLGGAKFTVFVPTSAAR